TLSLHDALPISLRAQADYEADLGEPRRALELYEELLDKVMAAKPDALNDLRDAPKLSQIFEALAQLYRRTGDAVKAETLEDRRRQLWQHWDRKLPNNPFVLRQIAAKPQ